SFVVGWPTPGPRQALRSFGEGIGGLAFTLQTLGTGSRARARCQTIPRGHPPARDEMGLIQDRARGSVLTFFTLPPRNGKSPSKKCSTDPRRPGINPHAAILELPLPSESAKCRGGNPQCASAE